jgi:hypothetical protein
MKACYRSLLCSSCCAAYLDEYCLNVVGDHVTAAAHQQTPDPAVLWNLDEPLFSQPAAANATLCELCYA